MKKLLTATSAAALILGIGLAPAFANPTLKRINGDVDIEIDIDTDDIRGNRDVAIESYNVAVLSENDLYGEVYSIDFERYVETGDIDLNDDVQQMAAGQFTQVFNTGVANVNQAAASIAANADVTFRSN